MKRIEEIFKKLWGVEAGSRKRKGKRERFGRGWCWMSKKRLSTYFRGTL
jgi:hypothetical protein